MEKKIYSGNKDCTVIILSYNTCEVTDICLTKVEAAKAYSEKKLGNSIKVIVVDNGSCDGSPDVIRKKHPGAILISLPENIGYPRGNNLAMKKVATPFILLLNNDAYLNEDTIQKALEYMDKKQSCDALCVRLTYPDGGFQPFGGSLPTPIKTILWNLGFESMPLVKLLINPIYQYDRKYFKREQKMEWSSTGFFFMRKRVYDLTGGFDSHLFLYMEDVEWCKRMKDKNISIYYTPDIAIVHLGEFTCKKFSRETLLDRHIEGMLYFHKIHYKKTYGIICKTLAFGVLVRAFFYVLIGNMEMASAYSSLCKRRFM